MRTRLKVVSEYDVRAGLFIKGPIPLWWLARAYRLGRPAIGVGLVAWLFVGMRKRGPAFLSSQHVFPTFGISRFGLYRGLQALERAGLVTIERRGGHAPFVRVVRTEAAMRTHRTRIARFRKPA